MYLLVFMVVLSVLEIDLYLASFPAIGQHFLTRETTIQNSLSLYLLVFSIAVVALGLLSNRYERKKLFLFSLFLDFLGTLCIVFTHTLPLFFLGRAFQAIGGAAGSLFSRIFAKKLYPSSSSATTFLFTGISIAIAIAPILGGYIAEKVHWQANFYLLLIFQGLLWFGVWKKLPKIDNKTPIVFSLKDEGLRIVQVFKLREFQRFGSLVVIAWAGFFAFVHGSPLLFMHQFKKSPSAFGWIFALIVSGMTLGTCLVQRFEKQRFSQKCWCGLGTLWLGGFLLIFASYYSCFFCSLMLFLYLLGLGVFLPLAQDKIGDSNPDLINTSFSLLIFCQMLGASIAGYTLTAFTYSFAMLYLIVFLTIISAFIFGLSLYNTQDQKTFLGETL